MKTVPPGFLMGCLVGEMDPNKIEFNISVKDGEWGNSRGVGTESEEYILELWLECRIHKISERKEGKDNLPSIR